MPSIAQLMVSLILCSSKSNARSKLRPVKVAVSSQKALQGFKTDTRELLEGTGFIDLDLPSRQSNCEVEFSQELPKHIKKSLDTTKPRDLEGTKCDISSLIRVHCFVPYDDFKQGKK